MSADPASQIAPLLAELPGLAYAFVLLIARIGAVMMMIPLLGEAEVPATVRAGFTLLLVVLLMPVLLPLLPTAPAGPLRAMAQVGAEIVTGLWLGWLARLAVFALVVAGQVISLATGLSNVLQPDPALGTQSAALARMMGVVAPLVLLASGLHALPIAALAASYRVAPAGLLLQASSTTSEIVAAMGGSFALAIQLAAPFLAASLLWHLAVALAGRLAAQLQPISIAMPVQVFGGLMLLALVPTGLIAVWREHVAEMLGALPGLR